ncbi:MAG: AhpC/TSA family protein [Prevotella sp.]|jgi:peroxiredoxin|nr:AhpC/TSA family protein [Prevotella sp.]
MKISKIISLSVIALAALSFASCGNKKFHVEGAISDAKDSTLYFENMSLNGPVTVDSLKLSEDGTFSFEGEAPEAPEFYRLKIAGQIINIAIDSTETVKVKASYPTMTSEYDVEGSEECSKIKELAILQLGLQSQINAIANDPTTGMDSAQVAIARTLEAYKTNVKNNFIFKAPMKAYAYFALFQTYTLGNTQNLIFSPRSNPDDVKVFAAVATSWDTFYPKAERGLNLHNIALEGMKDMRILRNEAATNQIDASKVSVAGIIDLALQDNKGITRHLTDLKGKVVLLDFHLFASKESLKRIMMLREIYNKYHAQGFEIYQVSLDGDEHFWKTQTAALPWISVNDASGASAKTYNVQAIPTYFLIDKTNSLYKRADQVTDLESEIKKLL